MYKHLMVPLDRSPFSESALPYARAVARQFNSKITLVSILEPLSPTAAEWAAHMAEMMLEMRNTARARTLQYLDGIKAELQAEGFEVEIHVAERAGVSQALLEIVEAIGADTMVMSTHGRTGLQRWMLGSVAERIVRQSSVPVLLVRVDDEAIEAADRARRAQAAG